MTAGGRTDMIVASGREISGSDGFPAGQPLRWELSVEQGPLFEE